MYTIRITKNFVKRISKLSAKDQQSIKLKLENLAKDPFSSPNCKKLKGYKNVYRMRHSNYRIIYEVNNSELIIIVINVGHRREIYAGY